MKISLVVLGFLTSGLVLADEQISCLRYLKTACPAVHDPASCQVETNKYLERTASNSCEAWAQLSHDLCRQGIDPKSVKIICTKVDL